MNNNKETEIVPDEFQAKVLSWIDRGNNLFVTGKAGTGKSEVIKKFIKKYTGKKFFAVLAPTGVAAKHVNGFTMHSFFRLPVGTPYLPDHEMLPSKAIHPVHQPSFW